MDLEHKLNAVVERIASACARVNRAPSEVTMVAVTKGQPPEVVQEAARLGLTLFGENKIQEAKAKLPLCSGKLHWHFIGHLQSNKARDAVRLFEMIQSVDSIDIAEELNRKAGEAAKTIPILIEVNIVGEASKFGYRAEKLRTDLPQLNRLKRLEIHGLMIVPPWSPEPETIRPVFRQLRELKQECQQILGAPLAHLSMGMSGDFEIAIEEGATMVRLGTALFGARPGIRKA
jgi:pyridoxal phosphate enzyme (YggS family)